MSLPLGLLGAGWPARPFISELGHNSLGFEEVAAPTSAHLINLLPTAPLPLAPPAPASAPRIPRNQKPVLPLRRSRSDQLDQLVEERGVEQIVSDRVKEKDTRTYPEAGKEMSAQEDQSKGWEGGKKTNQSEDRG